MKPPRKYRIRRFNQMGLELPARPDDNIVYQLLYHDYGAADKATYEMHIPHLAVTLKASGDYPYFVMAKRDLELLADP